MDNRLFLLQFLERRGWARLYNGNLQSATFARWTGFTTHFLTIDVFYGYERYQLCVGKNRYDNLAAYVSGK